MKTTILRRAGCGDWLVVVFLLLLGGGVVASQDANSDKNSSSNVVYFQLQNRFGPRQELRNNWAAIKAHDAEHHRRKLAAMRLPMYGKNVPAQKGVYYTTLAIGTPPKDYHFSIGTDTFSFWLNCEACQNCHKNKSTSLGHNFYSPSNSSTSKQITCGDSTCSLLMPGKEVCFGKQRSRPCSFEMQVPNYPSDFSTRRGYVVQDKIQLPRVSGDTQTAPVARDLVFGCSMFADPVNAVDPADGVIGLRKGTGTLIDQLSHSKEAKRVFSHCFDSHLGGGLFAIGNVVEQKLQTTETVSSDSSNEIILSDIEIGDMSINPAEDPTSKGMKVVLDTARVQTVFPSYVFVRLMEEIFESNGDLETHTETDEHYLCVKLHGAPNDILPVVKFHFNEATLSVAPETYMFNIAENNWCFSWLEGGFVDEDNVPYAAFGTGLLSERLFVYDLERSTVGWSKHQNCSSLKVRMKDDESGAVYKVEAEHKKTSAAATASPGGAAKIWTLFFFLVTAMLADLVV